MNLRGTFKYESRLASPSPRISVACDNQATSRRNGLRKNPTLPWRGEGRSREARAGWGDLSTRAVFGPERLSPHPVSHFAALNVSRPSPSRGG
ncbi:hypothetical protein EAS62_07715 [Bradyrhizobium zhanjiangense]|uniref:Uncharacterized protein n=1 Tax=Bradyrhizobium zhanjiangense TaxID=1325107 RepID=A0ABY0DQB6_9BRAD|nr:hypothetical protein EAS62_07715 [Bradyrhizobium zhanjiangense]